MPIPRTALAAGALLCACGGPGLPLQQPPEDMVTKARSPSREEHPDTTRLATFGAGCYWCVEAVFERLPGVLDVRSGFMGGRVEDPSYEAVCSGTTGHIEVVQVRFDPSRIDYDTLLDWFWKLHDPTSLDRQGADEGEQYRSVIFAHDEEQRRRAERSRERAQDGYGKPIVTEIRDAGPFYEAEAEHQDYFRRRSGQPYCRLVIAPKLEHLEQQGLPRDPPR
ncbi:MAG: hypothetical protein Fur0037_28550 [Planctomycetota bacterium]